MYIKLTIIKKVLNIPGVCSIWPVKSVSKKKEEEEEGCLSVNGNL